MSFDDVEARDVRITLGGGVTEPPWPVVIGSIPPGADYFQYRTLAWEKLLRAGPSRRGSVAGRPASLLCGLGGVGKTQLAAAYARHLLNGKEVDLLVWVPASTRAEIIDKYAQTAGSVGLGVAGEPEAAVARFLGWLSTTDRRWVIILDDLQAADDMRDLWPPDHRPHGHTVLTTRRSDASLRAGLEPIDIESFTIAEASAYLTQRLPAELADDAAGVAADLAGLPLALPHSAAYMEDSPLTCSGYRERFADRKRRLGELFPHTDNIFKGPAATVATTWSMSIEQANQLPPVGLAGPILELISMLDPNGIPTEVLTSRHAIGFLAARASTSTNNLEDDVQQGLANLRRFSLVTVTDSVVRVHALVQRAVRDALEVPISRAAARAAGDAVMGIWPVMEQGRAIVTLLRGNAAVLSTRSEAEDLWTSAGGVPRVFFRAAVSLGDAGLLTAALAAADQLYQEAERRFGADHGHCFELRHCLANWRGTGGDPVGATRAYEELLKDRLRLLGPDHPETLVASCNVARWRGESGEYARAAAEFEQLPGRLESTLGADDEHTLIARHNLAYWRGMAGDPAYAAAAFKQLGVARTRVLGPEDPETLITYANAARWQGEAGDPSGAATALELIPARLAAVLGPDHPSTLTVRNNWAYWRGMAGKPALAAADFEQLLDDRLRVLGPDHPDTLVTRANLANWRGVAGYPASAAAAAAALEQVLADYVRILGPDHPQTSTVRSDLVIWTRRRAEARGIRDRLPKTGQDARKPKKRKKRKKR
ncbi:FxSxx-COOH system tetratricopeptide repeat protein [Kribbella sp. CA-253562]|uniref:FxSxx-COOH system tetratricopeptide repeat protein n=1 Tax=Kribbella sp. CA-253562 TaxID=3239942 RepID=UPI003D8FE621